MNLLRKLGLFLIGLSIGAVITFFFFQKKGVEFCYLPNCRVLKDLRNKSIELSPEIQGYKVEDFSPIFKDGEVDFKRSDTHSKCRSYVIKGKNSQGVTLEIIVENCSEKATIKSVQELK